MASSIDDALQKVRSRGDSVGRVFIIGGAGVYASALESAASTRILLTRIQSDFDCDTFFPTELGGEDGDAAWRQESKDEMDAWVGETVPDGTQTESGIDYEFELWGRIG